MPRRRPPLAAHLAILVTAAAALSLVLVSLWAQHGCGTTGAIACVIEAIGAIGVWLVFSVVTSALWLARRPPAFTYGVGFGLAVLLAAAGLAAFLL